MVSILYFVGALIIIIGVLTGFFVPFGLPFVGGSIVSGIFFMALGKIVELLEKIEKKLPDQSISKTYRAREYFVKSSDFKVYDAHQKIYQFFSLDGDDFIQARVFKNYMEINGDSIVFKLPNKEQKEWVKQEAYNVSADLFTKDNIVFVKLSSLGISASHLGSSIVLSYTDDKILV